MVRGFFLPLLGANLLQSLYNLVDMAVVGRFVGSDGLAAVSSAVLLCYIISALCSGVTMGGGVLAAQYKGAGDAASLRESVNTLFLASAASSLLVTVAGQCAGAGDRDRAAQACKGARYLHICCSLNCVVYAAMYVWDSFATGVGWASLAMANSLLQSIVFRILFSWLLGTVLDLGYVGVFWAECLSPHPARRGGRGVFPLRPMAEAEPHLTGTARLPNLKARRLQESLSHSF